MRAHTELRKDGVDGALTKKGVEWATYLGQPVRWLREKPPTEENLLFVFEVMKMARYTQL